MSVDLSKPPNFSKIDPFEGRSGKDLTLVDRVRAAVIRAMNPEEGKKMKSKLGPVKLADDVPRIAYKSVGERDQPVEPKPIQVGDLELSPQYLAFRFGLVPFDKQQSSPKDPRKGMLGYISAARNQTPDDNRQAPFREESLSKSSALGSSIDTAAQRAGLYAIKKIRDAVNSGKKLPRTEQHEMAKKEALQTLFLAGFLKEAKTLSKGVVGTPAALKAFLQGFLANTKVGAGLLPTSGRFPMPGAKLTPAPMASPVPVGMMVRRLQKNFPAGATGGSGHFTTTEGRLPHQWQTPVKT